MLGPVELIVVVCVLCGIVMWVRRAAIFAAIRGEQPNTIQGIAIVIGIAILAVGLYQLQALSEESQMRSPDPGNTRIAIVTTIVGALTLIGGILALGRGNAKK